MGGQQAQGWKRQRELSGGIVAATLLWEGQCFSGEERLPSCSPTLAPSEEQLFLMTLGLPFLRGVFCSLRREGTLLSGRKLAAAPWGVSLLLQCCPLAPPWTSTATTGSASAGPGSAMETMTVRMIPMNRTAVSHLCEGRGWVQSLPATAGQSWPF